MRARFRILLLKYYWLLFIPIVVGLAVELIKESWKKPDPSPVTSPSAVNSSPQPSSEPLQTVSAPPAASASPSSSQTAAQPPAPLSSSTAPSTPATPSQAARPKEPPTFAEIMQEIEREQGYRVFDNVPEEIGRDRVPTWGEMKRDWERGSRH